MNGTYFLKFKFAVSFKFHSQRFFFLEVSALHYRPDQVLVDAAKLWPELWHLSSLGNLPGIYTDGEDAAPETCLTTLMHCNEELGSLCLKNKTRQGLHSSKISQDVSLVAK